MAIYLNSPLLTRGKKAKKHQITGESKPLTLTLFFYSHSHLIF